MTKPVPPSGNPPRLDDLYREVLVAASPDRIVLWFDRGVWGGCALLVLSIAFGVVMVLFPLTKSVLYFVISVTFLLGLMLVTVGSILGMGATLWRQYVRSRERYERAYDDYMRLAQRVADHIPYDKIQERLELIRLEIALNTRAPDKVPIAAGLIAAVACAMQVIIAAGDPSALAAIQEQILMAVKEGKLLQGGLASVGPTSAILALATTISVFAARVRIHEAQDRLLRVEAVLKRAEVLSRTPPRRSAQSPSQDLGLWTRLTRRRR